MKLLSFKGGVHPADNKNITADIPIKNAQMCSEYIYPLSQHIGAPCTPCVAVGDRVLRGQVIADSDAFVSAPVHSAVSGTVKAITPHLVHNGATVNSIIIENDFLEESVDFKGKSFEEATCEDIIASVRAAGIVGMGGAGFPTHVKLTVPKNTKIDTIIVNGAECEPYLTSDYRVMLESPELIVDGLRLAMKAVGVKSGKIAVEANKPEGIKALGMAAKGYDGIEVCPLKTKYPQGSEKHIIYAVTSREVKSGCLPSSAGVIVINIDTAVAIANAVLFGMPLLRRIVTVSGRAIKNPGNFSVKCGTPVSELINQAGGFKAEPAKILGGGPMMGFALKTTDVPVTKGVSAILSLDSSEAPIFDESPCIRCGKCMPACPMRLAPMLLNKAVSEGDLDKAQELNIMDCIECGACAYACPAKRHLTQSCRLGKASLRARKENK